MAFMGNYNADLNASTTLSALMECAARNNNPHHVMCSRSETAADKQPYQPDCPYMANDVISGRT